MFVSPSRGKLNLEEVVTDIVEYMNQDTRSRYSLIIGTDSQVNVPLQRPAGDKGKTVDFVNAIVAHRIGKGGRYFWRRIHREYNAPITLKARMFTETHLSIELALQLLTLLQQSLADAFVERQPSMEVHIDVGQNGPTRELIKELVGLVRNNGFAARIKPESYVASTVADRYA